MGKQRSVDTSRFAMVPRADVPRSAFDVMFAHKTTFDAGFLIPVYIDEVLPGDSFRVRMTAFARLATPLVPLMDNLVLESFFFYMPSRLLWDNWNRFMGEQLTPTDATEFLLPQAIINGTGVSTDMGPGKLADYFGIWDNNSGVDAVVNALPFRMYSHVWNEWFRDQNLQSKLVVASDDGPDPVNTYVLARRGKRHDYFTSCLPWPQKPTAATILGQTGAPIVPGGSMKFPQAGAPVSGLGVAAGAATPPSGAVLTSGHRTVSWADSHNTFDQPWHMSSVDGFPDVRVLVNDIRTANVIQVMLERNARGGTRYAEIVRSHFGVTSPDARLQRPEYLGGGRAFVNINPVAQTSASGATGTTTVLGELAGIGTAVASGHGFSASFTEHGYVMGLINVRADLTYQQGIERMWHRRTLYDFYWPGLANLGEQVVLTREIFADGSATDTTVFGYQERWAEYRHKPSRISGLFRSESAADPLDMWHLAQWFVTAPVLNEAFITDQPPVSRVLQLQQTFGEQFLVDCMFDLRMVRPMPMFSIPGLGPRL